MNRKHRVLYTIIRPFAAIFLKLKFGYKYKIAENLPENYIVLSNHATDYDPILVGVSFKIQMYFVASEHIARWGFTYKLIDFLLAPIVRYKGKLAASTTLSILKKLRKGDNICIFAEGVRTWDGVTAPIHPTTAKLVKSAKCGLVTYKLTGGYFTSPMWSGKNTRRGKLSGEVVNVYSKEQLAEMSLDEIAAIITADLHEDAYETQEREKVKYKGKRLAENLENLLFICPKCGSYDSFFSKGSKVNCKDCDYSFEYDEYGMLSDDKLNTVKKFSDYQQKIIETDVKENKTYSADFATISTVENHVETRIGEGRLTMNTDIFQCGEVCIPLSNISEMAMHGKRALVFSANDKYYEVIPASGFNSLKFHLYYQEYQKVKDNK